MSEQAFVDWKLSHQLKIEEALLRFLPAQGSDSSVLIEAMRYAVLEGGKRVRPLCVFAAGKLTKADSQDLEPVASAVEMIHAYSLIHDDMPAMDDDDLRRGKPSCHIAFGEGMALLAGDALQSLAFETLSKASARITPQKQLMMIQMLSQAIGYSGMALGQAIDLSSIGKTLTLPDIERMHSLKTGALLRASIELGALCGSHLPPSKKAKLHTVAKQIGLLFQMVDDILDCEATTPMLGKIARKDIQHHKPTYVSVLGLEKAKRGVEKLYHAIETELFLWGAPAGHLLSLTDEIAHRSL